MTYFLFSFCIRITTYIFNCHSYIAIYVISYISNKEEPLIYKDSTVLTLYAISNHLRRLYANLDALF